MQNRLILLFMIGETERVARLRGGGKVGGRRLIQNTNNYTVQILLSGFVGWAVGKSFLLSTETILKFTCLVWLIQSYILLACECFVCRKHCD